MQENHQAATRTLKQRVKAGVGDKEGSFLSWQEKEKAASLKPAMQQNNREIALIL